SVDNSKVTPSSARALSKVCTALREPVQCPTTISSDRSASHEAGPHFMQLVHARCKVLFPKLQNLFSQIQDVICRVRFANLRDHICYLAFMDPIRRVHTGLS